MPFVKETSDENIKARLLKGAVRTPSGCLERPHAGQQKAHTASRWYTQIRTMKGGVLQTRLAHREAYRLFVGELVEGLVVMHSCDNPRCIEPTHLSLGTQLENISSAASKGRMRKFVTQ